MSIAATPPYSPEPPNFYKLKSWFYVKENARKVFPYVRELYDSYVLYWFMHRFVSIIFFVTIGLGVWHLVQFFGEHVLIPARPD
jgi:hypothetical protein